MAKIDIVLDKSVKVFVDGKTINGILTINHNDEGNLVLEVLADEYSVAVNGKTRKFTKQEILNKKIYFD